MTKANLSKFIKDVKVSVIKHSPEILTGLGLAGMVSTTVLAVKATPKAIRLIEEAQNEKGEELRTSEKVKAAWKCYIPTAITGGVSMACIIGASSVSAGRNAALATAYKLSEAALVEYRDQVVETIGEKKEQVVRDKVAQEKIKKHPVSSNEVISTGKGDTLCFEPLSSRYFKSNIELIRRAENTLNKKILHEVCGSTSLNDFYDELGLARTDLGDRMGWDSDNMLELDFSYAPAEDETPCLVVGHYNPPKYGYY